MLPQVRLAWAAAYTIDMSRKAMWRKALGGSDEMVRDMTKQWSIGLGERAGIEVRAFGLEHIDWSRPCVLMANHQSYLDVHALFRVVPRVFGFVAKKSLFSVPFFGGVMRGVGCVPIDRDKKKQAFEAVREAAEIVAAGTIIGVFPEGTRSAGDRIAPLKKGPFYLAQAAKVPVVPIGIRGTAALMPRTNTTMYPGVSEVHVGPPIPAIGPGNEARNELMRRVRAEISRLAELPMID
jgi:1-acyl-sn-glycerol-3-phosphate acyltransferase